MDFNNENKIKFEVPENKFVVTYVWKNRHYQPLQSKRRTVDFRPNKIEEIPLWTHRNVDKVDEFFLKPCAMYNDPFNGGSHILVLCEVFDSNDSPLTENGSNFRALCRENLLKEKVVEKDFWFGFVQTFNFSHLDGDSLELPKKVIQKVVDAHYRACLHAGIKISGIGEGYDDMKEFYIGPANGIRAGDDLLMAQFLLTRIADRNGIQDNINRLIAHKTQNLIVNISTKEMRSEGGLKCIETTIEKLNRINSTISNNICIPLIVKHKGKGYFQHSSPNADPYKIVKNIVKLFFD